MTGRPAFGRRHPGLRGTARRGAESNDRATAHLVRAYSETEDYARGLIEADRDRRAAGIRRTLIGGAAALLALTLALPYLGVDFSQQTLVAAVDFDELSPSELADLAPAAGEARNAVEGLLDRLLD